jgi:hypothetical protein
MRRATFAPRGTRTNIRREPQRSENPPLKEPLNSTGGEHSRQEPGLFDGGDTQPQLPESTPEGGATHAHWLS